MSSVNELWGWPQSPGSVILGPCGCADKEVLKKKRERRSWYSWVACWAASGSFKELSTAYFCCVRLKTNKRK